MAVFSQAALRQTGGVLLFLLLLLCSCEVKEPAAFAYYGAGSGLTLYGLSKDAAAGRVEFARFKPAKIPLLRYVFEPPLVIPRNYSLELAYRFEPDPPFGGAGLALEIGEDSWTLPGDASSLGLDETPRKIRYAPPVAEGTLPGFSLRFFAGPSGEGFSPSAFFELESLALIPRRYGFFWDEDGLSLTPFVSSHNGVLVIEPPPRYGVDGPVELAVAGPGRRITVERGGTEIEHYFPAGDLPWELRIPPALLGASALDEPWPVRVVSDTFPEALELSAAPDCPFPLEPIPADPGLVLAYPRESWRDGRYEVFRWPRFPSILIFDTADYQVQEKLFKRLAFFVEKAGYRGRLLSDREMEGLHGWNAHDYRAEDLARFFEAVGRSSFPLSPEERELRSILLAAGIIVQAGEELRDGEGAVISISRESSASLRSRFITHEGFHGLFFVDDDFSDFSRRRWESLNPQAKRFLLSYFDYQHYDIRDPYLVANEFMAYCLQQPVSQAGSYFGENLAKVIEASSWRFTVLPPKDEATGSWPLLAKVFTGEAEAFSAYVNRRWGFAAGRLHSAALRLAD